MEVYNGKPTLFGNTHMLVPNEGNFKKSRVFFSGNMLSSKAAAETPREDEVATTNSRPPHPTAVPVGHERRFNQGGAGRSWKTCPEDDPFDWLSIPQNPDPSQ